MGLSDIILLVFLIAAALAVGFYFLNKWAYKRMNTQNEMIEQYKTTQTAYIIDKKRDKAANVNLPKAIQEKMPKMSKFLKLNFVKVKIGPQILTLMADKNVYKALPLKKSIKIDIAGLYIVSMAGYKTPEQMRAIEKEKKEKAKQAKKEAKKKNKK